MASDTGANTFLADTNTGILSSGTWYNILLTRTGDNIDIYLDNVSQTISYSNQSYISTYLSTLGTGVLNMGVMNSNFAATPTRLDGSLQTFAWFERVLDQNERDLLHNYYSY